MTPSHDAPLCDGLLRANPVYLLERFSGRIPAGIRGLLADLHAEQVPLSPSAWQYAHNQGVPAEELPPPCAGPEGIIGLSYLRPHGPGFITPLTARLGDEWEVAPNLPFSEPELRQALEQLLRGADPHLRAWSTELFAFEVRDAVGQPLTGTSMTVSALLAIVLAMADAPPPLFRAACAVVELAEGGRLRPVSLDSIPSKLEAFQRECGRGSLLIRTRDCPSADAFNEHFEVVWTVDSLAELARRLDESKMLRGFRQHTPLNRVRFRGARDYLLRQKHRYFHYRETLPPARHLLQHPREADVPLRYVTTIRELICDLERHLGCYHAAVGSAERALKRIGRRPEHYSHDEQARGAVALAAALFDAHRFAEARRVLAPWEDRLAADPSLTPPETRIRVWNTLARVETVLGGDWESLFRRSLALQRTVDRGDAPRTGVYHVHALLRHDRWKEAERAIRCARQSAKNAEFAGWMLTFAEADLARRRGKLWSDPEMDRRRPEAGPTGHPFGFYFQATARQPGRASDDAAQRLLRGMEFLEIDLAPRRGSRGGANLLSFLADCLRLRAAAETEDRLSWRQVRRALQRSLELNAARGLKAHYGSVCARLGEDPSREQAESLLNLVPYF